MDNEKELIRLQLFLARCGVGSRRACEDFIAAGRVMVNGKAVLKPGFKVSDQDEVVFDNHRVKPTTKHIYLALHKPSGFICSNQDRDGRPLAIDLITPSVKQRLFNVGRLDYMTSGLIFFTNDGEFGKVMTHPSSHVEKEYIVTSKKEIPQELMEQFRRGMIVKGVKYRLKKYTFKGKRTVSIVLEEGKNNELRRVFLSRNITIKSIHRVRIGSVNLNGIAPGHFRKLTQREVNSLLAQSEKNKEQNRNKR